MQIDFHHAVTYVTARLAGFRKKEADIIAHAAQYVDDATSHGPVRFKNRFLYDRISSAHKMIDLRNGRDLKNHQVWIPFHFLPGNGGLPRGEKPGGKVVHQLVCTPDSPVARDMVRQAIIDRGKPYGLYRLGITMHVYADTWAHQGFAGLVDPVNEVEDADEVGDTTVFSGRLNEWLRDILDDAIPALGHGRANIFPDMPFLRWQYEDYAKNTVIRDNTRDFLQAADEMCRAMQRYIAGDPNAPAPGINDGDRARLEELFSTIQDKKGEARHEMWLRHIADGAFSFGAEEVVYITDRPGSWKDQALGTYGELEVYSFKKSFLKSHWKLFHDAVLAHRFFVVNELLPEYGICAA